MKLFSAVWNGTKWNISTAIGPTSGGAAITLNNNDTPYIAYGTDPKAYFATWNGSAWVSEMFDVVGYYMSIAVTPDGKPYISYVDLSDTNHYKLKIAYKNNTIWENETIDTSKNASEQITHTSIAIDQLGYVHIAYNKGSAGLWYATNKPLGVNEFTVLIIPAVILIALFVIVIKRRKNKHSEQFY